MTAVLKVKDDGAWRTVVEPYVNVDGTWKTVHNIWIKHGDTWRLSHKTAVGRYSAGTTITDTGTSGVGLSGSYTVPTGVRYLRVTVIGGGGKGGGGARTGGQGGVYDYYTCPGGSWSSTSTSTIATGGAGGYGGLVDCTIEVIPGETYNWFGGTNGTGGGWGGGILTLAPNIHYQPQTSVGSSSTGSVGYSGGFTRFTGNSATLDAGSGTGGAGGGVTVSSSCSTLLGLGSTPYYGYVVTATNPGRSGTSGNSISATNLITTHTNGNSGTGGGAGGGGDAVGSNGTTGSVSIIPYGDN